MAEIISVDAKSPGFAPINRAAELLRQGQVVAIPTDTFYGLAANPFDPAAVGKIFEIKGRPKSNPLLLLVNSLEMAARLSANLPPHFYKLVHRFWPGPLTIVVEAAPNLPPETTAHTGRIGLRLPAARIPLELIGAAGFPITATSANLTGEQDSSTAQQVQISLGDRLSLILDGGISRADKPSTVLDLNGEIWRIVREGAISRDEIIKLFDSTRGAWEIDPG